MIVSGKSLTMWKGNSAPCESCYVRNFNDATCIVGGVRPLRLQPLFHFLWHLFSNVEVEFFHLLYTYILLIQIILYSSNVFLSSFLLVQLDCSMFDILLLRLYPCWLPPPPIIIFISFFFFILFPLIFISQILHAPSLSILTPPCSSNAETHKQNLFSQYGVSLSKIWSPGQGREENWIKSWRWRTSSWTWDCYAGENDSMLLSDIYVLTFSVYGVSYLFI